MSTTEHYGLYLEDSSTTQFKEWREKINGTADSNMIKIDNALAALDAKIGDVDTIIAQINALIGE